MKALVLIIKAQNFCFEKLHKFLDWVDAQLKDLLMRITGVLYKLKIMT